MSKSNSSKRHSFLKSRAACFSFMISCRRSPISFRSTRPIIFRKPVSRFQRSTPNGMSIARPSRRKLRTTTHSCKSSPTINLDSIAYKKHYFEAVADFGEAESFIASQDSVYKRLYETAIEYSLLKQLATQLETLKGKEQLLFADIQAKYEAAKNIAQEFGELQPRFQIIEENFITLKNNSEKIQAQEYKPIFQRIKDYLYGLAAVAMILMFINMAQAKIKMIKQARENAKKLSQMMNKDENDYPTI